MKINGWDISEANARQWNVTFEHNEIDNDSEWVSGAASPVLLNSTLDFKELSITLLVKGSSREEIVLNRSTILSKLLAPAVLELDGYSHFFKGVLTKASATEQGTKKRFHTLKLTFNCYEYGAEQAIEKNKLESFTINNPGNLTTPAIIEITPTVGLATLTITGIVRNARTGVDLPVTVKTLTTNKKVVLDGETGLITEDGVLKAGDVETYGLPSLLPGTNTIALDNGFMNVAVKFKPRYI